VSITQEYETALLTLPAGSIAFTWNTWVPDARLLYAFGDEHARYVTESRAHRNVEPPSFDENEKDAVVEPVGDVGFAVMLAVGGVVSIVHGYWVGFPSNPRESVATREGATLDQRRVA
jgi:hypothetical protein